MRRGKFPILAADSIWESGARGRRIFRHRGEDLLGRMVPEATGQSKQFLIRFFIFLILAIFAGRLFQLTVVDGKKLRSWADNNSIRLVEIEAKRGRIFDRNGRVLAESVEEYFLVRNQTKTRISKEQAAELEREGLAGENFEGELGRITREVVRNYPYGQVGAHVLGYTSQVQEADLLNFPNKKPSAFVGRLGVEQTYDQVLSGVDGAKIIEVDAIGRTITILGEQPARDGQDITLTVDIDIAQKTYEALGAALAKAGASSGAAIVSDPQNGEIVALLSFPAFDPADVGRFVARGDQPLYNRAIAGNYTPGSVFKIVSAISGLESGVVDRDTQIEDVGEFELGGQTFPNWFYKVYGGRDGFLKIDKAIARSNDIFFYRLGEMSGLSQLRRTALSFGFGQKTGIDLPGESFGLVGDEIWKRANLGENWFLGDTMHFAIGQGFVAATPLQVNLMTAAVANGGWRVVPHTVSAVSTEEGTKIIVGESKQENLGIAGENLEIVRSGMRQACQEKGTAWPFFNSSYPVFCKTGTAERALGNPHAWFTAYAPDTLPQVAITIIIEDGGEGSSVAAPVAREILDWWFVNKFKVKN